MRSNFLKFSSALVIAALVALAAISGTSVQANNSNQAATMAATMGSTMASGAMMSTMAATGGAYPPCPTSSMAATMAATMMSGAATMMATPMMATTMMATPMMSATMMATPSMAMTMPAASMIVSPFVANNGCEFKATLMGKNEVPKAGDPNGQGTADVFVTRPASGPGQICFKLTVSGIKLPASASHIHMGAEGVAGPVVIPFAPPDASGSASGCTSGVDPTLIGSIIANPSGFYVNVHNTDFPAGAMRGQLSAASGS